MKGKTDSLCLRDTIRLGVSKRIDFPLRRRKAALLVVDIQSYCCDGESEYYQKESLPRMITNAENLLHIFRLFRDTSSDDRSSSNACEVVFTAIQAMTKDGRDVSLDYKLSGPYFAKLPMVGESIESVFLSTIQPDFVTGKGDLYIPKTASSVFHSTNIDYVLRNLNVEQLVVVGQLTEQCVESTVRNAADIGYLVSVVHDACASHSLEKHQQGLAGMQGYCRLVDTQQVIDELEKDYQ